MSTDEDPFVRVGNRMMREGEYVEWANRRAALVKSLRDLDGNQTAVQTITLIAKAMAEMLDDYR